MRRGKSESELKSFAETERVACQGVPKRHDTPQAYQDSAREPDAKRQTKHQGCFDVGVDGPGSSHANTSAPEKVKGIAAEVRTLPSGAVATPPSVPCLFMFLLES